MNIMKMRKALAILIAVILMFPMVSNVLAIEDHKIAVQGTTDNNYPGSTKDGDTVSARFDIKSASGNIASYLAGQFMLVYDNDALEVTGIKSSTRNYKIMDDDDGEYIPGSNSIHMTIYYDTSDTIPPPVDSNGLALSVLVEFEVKNVEKLKGNGTSPRMEVFNNDASVLSTSGATIENRVMGGVSWDITPAVITVAGGQTTTYSVTTPQNLTGGTVTATPNSNLTGNGQETVTITVTPDNGYNPEFGNASNAQPTVKDASGNDITLTPGTTANTWTFTMPAANVTVSGVSFSAQKYTATAASNNNGTIQVNGQRQVEVPAGTEIKVTATPTNPDLVVTKVTYTPEGGRDAVEVKIQNGEYKFNMPKSNVTVDAEFSQSHPITINEGKDNAKVNVDGKVYDPNTETPKAAAGQLVIIGSKSGLKTVSGITVKTAGGVTVTPEGTNSFKMPNEPVTVDVTYRNKDDDPVGGKQYTLTYMDGTTEYAKVKFDENYTVVPADEVAAPAKTGANFLGWFDAALENEITSIKMDADKTVYAKWDGTGGGGSTDPRPYGEGNNITPDAFNAEEHVKFIDGYEDGTVRPNSNITRAEVASMIYRLLKESVRTQIYATTNKFSDVPATKWYNVAVSSMANGGYIAGYPDGTFGGERNITRAEFVTMLANFLDAPISGTINLSDVEAKHWAYNSIVTAVSAGWVSGYEDGTFRPNRELTRAEAISILNRVLNRNPESEQDMAEGMRNFSDNMDSGKWYYIDILEAANGHDFVRNENGREKWV